MKALIFGLVGVAAVALLASGATAGQLKGALSPLEPLIGTWEVQAKWSTGAPMWARTRYEPALDGHFLAGRTLVIEQNGTLYERYRTMISADGDRGVFPSHTFAYTGDLSVIDLVPVEGEPGSFTAQWTSGDAQVKESTTLRGDDRLEWKVWTKLPGDTEWELSLDAEWKKTGDSQPMFAPRLPLIDAMSSLRPLLGAWEVNSAWPDGLALWGLAKYEAAPGGAYVTGITLARDGNAQPYERYRSFLIKNAGGDGIDEVTFTHKGAVVTSHATVTAGPAPVLEITTPSGAENPREMVKRIEFEGDDAFVWSIRAREPGSESWLPVAEGTWRRVSRPDGAAPMPIDPALFVASGPDVRSFTRETTIDAPPETVFKAWSSKQGWEEAYAKNSPGTAANIDLAVGGRYEWLFGGVLGSNGCQLLSYIPNRMISFTWNAPPTQPLSRAMRTWVVVELTPEGAGTKVTLTHLGFGQGEHWDETFEYFGNAWNFVLNRMKDSLEAKGE